MSRGTKFLPLRLDPRWRPFVERYAHDLPRFAIEVCGLDITHQQDEVFQSVQGVGSRTSVSSGHGTGKTAAYAVITLWHLLCYEFSNTLLSAPKLDTVLSGVRKYVADYHALIAAGPHAWIAQHVVIAHRSIYIRGYKSQWWVQAKTAPAGKPEAMAGEHRRFLLWLIDEASGVDDAVLNVILGSLTEDWNRICLASQPTRNTGVFYDTHHSLSVGEGGPWTNITLSSEESPLVSDTFIREKLHQYGGRHEALYQIKVLGKFPDKIDGQLLSRQDMESCIGKPSVISRGDQWGWVQSVDVGAGEWRDKSVIVLSKITGFGQFFSPSPRKMHVVRVPVMSNSIQPSSLAAEIVSIAGRFPGIITLIDVGGMGLMVYKQLAELGVPNLVKVRWGDPCFKRELQEQYDNQRSMGMVSAAKAMQHDQLSIAENAFNSAEDKAEFLKQHRIPYEHDSKARYNIFSKGSKEWGNIPSPDVYDAISFPFLECARFNPVDEDDPADQASELDKAGAVAALKARREALRQQLASEAWKGAEVATNAA